MGKKNFHTGIGIRGIMRVSVGCSSIGFDEQCKCEVAVGLLVVVILCVSKSGGAAAAYPHHPHPFVYSHEIIFSSLVFIITIRVWPVKCVPRSVVTRAVTMIHFIKSTNNMHSHLQWIFG